MRVVLADDNALFIEGIRTALQEAEDIEIVGEAHNAAEVPALVQRSAAEVVVLSVQMPGGSACLDLLSSEHPTVTVIVLSETSEPSRVRAAFRRGASGYIARSVNPLDFPSALRLAVEQSAFTALGIPDREETDGALGAALTNRELAILKAVAAGLSNQAIAKELWVTEQTVKFHLTNIYRRLGVRNRTQAARYAHRHGLI
jgi:DNA-binding NarL/FixJ family response regulator